MKRRFLFISSFVLATCSFGQGDKVPELGSGDLIDPNNPELANSTYQIGEEWGKNQVESDDFEKVLTLERIAMGTVKLRGATGFYIGKYNGKHLVATNNHVCPSSSSCSRSSANFTQLGQSFRVDQFLGTWPGIDFALMSIKVAEENEGQLASIANPIDFQSPIYQGQPLITVGFGSANNPWRRMMGNWDSDCKTFSQENEFRFMSDPDSLNPGQNKTWSFSNGCDVSHGDSGSAMVDRETGRVVGIIWTGKIPKSAEVRDGAYLEDIFTNNSEDVWTELSYAVPSAKIAEFLQEEISNPETSPDVAETFTAVLTEVSEN